MSTRANYIFKSGRKTLATFYIHHDGYPEGAAEYFHKALIFGDGKINSPEYVRYVAEKLAEIKTVSYEQCCEQLKKNVQKFFGCFKD